MIAILDFGSQYSKLIARKIREQKVYSEILPHDSSWETLRKKKPEGIILSGGPASVYDGDAPDFHDALLHSGIPLLGICYGMQLLVKKLGGKVLQSNTHEYGKAYFVARHQSPLLEGLSYPLQVWMSHGDSVYDLPGTFRELGRSQDNSIAAMENPDKKIYGLQFHPEVSHTPCGTEIIQNFLLKICLCKQTWTTQSFVENAVTEIKETVGDKHVLCAVSGGIDSTTVAALLQQAIGNKLSCMFINHGFMRKNETANIKKLLQKKLGIKLIYIDAAERFFRKIRGISNPEEKRKCIGKEFIRTFEEGVRNLSAAHPFLAQGTLYPDIIESAHPSIGKAAVTIKTHHNVGGLPEEMGFRIIEPLKNLFKDEVRKIGAELGIPLEIIQRQPFPGPGLAIRILGEITPERVEILQDADAIVMEEVKKAGYYTQLWQSFAVLLPVKTVGIQGDSRSYLHTIAVRAVTSSDAMTADWARLPYELLETISSRIINEVRKINRVVYDISSKPPATIEWE